MNENKVFQRIFTSISNDYERERIKKPLFDTHTAMAEDFSKVCTAEGKQTYTSLIETKDEFAEGTKRSFKSFVYHYMEDWLYKYINKLSHFVTAQTFGMMWS